MHEKVLNSKMGLDVHAGQLGLLARTRSNVASHYACMISISAVGEFTYVHFKAVDLISGICTTVSVYSKIKF